MKRLYVYSKPNQMDGYKRKLDENKNPEDEYYHRYTDDVALCYADNLEEAIDIFGKLYDKDLIKDYVKEASFNAYGVCVCTDY